MSVFDFESYLLVLVSSTLTVYQGPMGNHANTHVTQTVKTHLATQRPVSVRMAVRQDIIRMGQRVNPVRRVMTVKQIRANRLVVRQPHHRYAPSRTAMCVARLTFVRNV